MCSLETSQQDKVEEIKTLQTSINGSSFEVGRRNSSSKSERYQYDELRYDQCSLQWKETHEVREADRRTLLEIIEVTAPLRLIDAAAVRTDKLKNSGYLVSVLTQKLKPGIILHERNVFEDGTENESTGMQTGYGFYFGDGKVAQKVAKTIMSLVHSCNQK